MFENRRSNQTRQRTLFGRREQKAELAGFYIRIIGYLISFLTAATATICPFFTGRAKLIVIFFSIFFLLEASNAKAQGFLYTYSSDTAICLGGSADLKINILDSAAVFHTGSNDYISIPSHDEINRTVILDRTIALWFRANNNTNRQVLYEEGGTTNGINIYLLNGRIYVNVWGSNIMLGDLSASVAAGQWHHIALVVDGGLALLVPNFKMYMDGNLIGSTYNVALITGIPIHNSDIHIGFSGNTRYTDGAINGSFYYSGFLDEFKLWNSALTGAQIAAEMWKGSSGAMGQIIYYDFNNDVGNSIKDVSGVTIHNGSIINGVTHSTVTPFRVAISWSHNGATTTTTTVSPTVTTDYTFTLTHFFTPPHYATVQETINVRVVPALVSVTGGGAYCSGETGVAVGLSGSESDVSYSLYRNGVTLVETMNGTGGAMNFSNQTIAGTYTVVATTSAPLPACQRTMSGSVTVTINPPANHNVEF